MWLTLVGFHAAVAEDQSLKVGLKGMSTPWGYSETVFHHASLQHFWRVSLSCSHGPPAPVHSYLHLANNTHCVRNLFLSGVYTSVHLNWHRTPAVEHLPLPSSKSNSLILSLLLVAIVTYICTTDRRCDSKGGPHVLSHCNSHPLKPTSEFVLEPIECYATLNISNVPSASYYLVCC